MADNLEMANFAIDGVTNLTQVDGEVKFFFKGDINQVTRLISAQPVGDVLIEEPTLEEIFIHYYD